MAGSPSSGTMARRTSGHPLSHFSRPRTGSASAGYRTTGPATPGRPPPGSGRGVGGSDASAVADVLSIDRFVVI